MNRPADARRSLLVGLGAVTGQLEGTLDGRRDTLELALGGANQPLSVLDLALDPLLFFLEKVQRHGSGVVCSKYLRSLSSIGYGGWGGRFSPSEVWRKIEKLIAPFGKRARRSA